METVKQRNRKQKNGKQKTTRKKRRKLIMMKKALVLGLAGAMLLGATGVVNAEEELSGSITGSGLSLIHI